MQDPSNPRPVTRSLISIAAVLLIAALWPATAHCQQADGATQSLKILPDWDPLDPWCALDANALSSCTGTYNCGAVSVPCLPVRAGLRLVAAGMGQRNSDTGTIEVRGAPPESQLVASWLVWGVITRDPDDPLIKMAFIDDVSVTGQEFGRTDEPCWETDALQDTRFLALWADVTSILEGKINGDFAVSISGSSIIDGRDPWTGPGQTAPLDRGHLVEGASLVTVFADPSVARDAKVILHKTTDLMIGAANYDLNVPTLPAATHVQQLRIGGDGQKQNLDQALAPFKTSIAFDDGPFLVLRGAGSPIDVYADWQGTDGGPINQLWDTQLTSVSASLLPELNGASSYKVSYEPDVDSGLPYDCVAVVLHGLSVYSLEP